MGTPAKLTTVQKEGFLTFTVVSLKQEGKEKSLKKDLPFSTQLVPNLWSQGHIRALWHLLSSPLQQSVVGAFTQIRSCNVTDS